MFRWNISLRSKSANLCQPPILVTSPVETNRNEKKLWEEIQKELW